MCKYIEGYAYVFLENIYRTKQCQGKDEKLNVTYETRSRQTWNFPFDNARQSGCYYNILTAKQKNPSRIHPIYSKKLFK